MTTQDQFEVSNSYTIPTVSIKLILSKFDFTRHKIACFFWATEAAHVFIAARFEFFSAKWVPKTEKTGKSYIKILHFQEGLWGTKR